MIAKIAFVFPGQGSQYVGMAREFIESDSEINVHLDQFRYRTDYDLEEIMLKGSEEQLKDTRFTQPAILMHSICALNAFQKQTGIKPSYVAGHSLGEFSALVANGCLSLDDATYLVHKRGEYMIRANEGRPYAMAAILGLSPDQVVDICYEAEDAGVVIAANFNTPVQTVISGTKAGVDKAIILANEAGAKRIIPLVVGGAFHSTLIAKAETWLHNEIAKIEFKKPEVPVIANVDALPYTDPDQIKDNLIRQICSPVMWLNSVEYMISQDVNIFIEFGPQTVLSGMLRKINKEAIALNVEKKEDITIVRDKLQDLSK
jgi:[acyl-carrier-protein] S-malonyltransferase